MPAKVLVIGAGPAGTASALRLRRMGHEVTVIDKATFPRDKCCGDGLTTNALRRLEELGLDPSRVAHWRDTRDVSIRTPRGREVRLHLPDGPGRFAAIAPRSELDHALVELCRDNGIAVMEGCSFESVRVNDGERAVVRVEGFGDAAVDWVVAADGMWSPVRKSLGLSTAGYLGEWHAFRQYIDNVTGTAADTLHIWFDRDLLPGYAWSFPLPDGSVNFGVGILRQSGRGVQWMNDMWHDLLQRSHIVEALGAGFEPRGRHMAWPIPARIDSAVRSAGRVLFVGDAVCATDVLTGEGIGQALESGIAAADAIDAGGAGSDVRTRYSRHLDRLFMADHRMSTALGRVLASPRVAEGVLQMVDHNDWTRRNFVRWMFEDEARAAAVTPRRWHRRFLRRPGAYAD